MARTAGSASWKAHRLRAPERRGCDMWTVHHTKTTQVLVLWLTSRLALFATLRLPPDQVGWVCERAVHVCDVQALHSILERSVRDADGHNEAMIRPRLRQKRIGAALGRSM